MVSKQGTIGKKLVIYHIHCILRLKYLLNYLRSWWNVNDYFHTWRFDKTVEGRGSWLLLPNHSGWLLPCLLSQFRNAKTKRSAWVGVNVIFVYCLLTSEEPSNVFERKTFSWPWRTIMSPSYTLFEVQCSCHLGTT